MLLRTLQLGVSRQTRQLAFRPSHAAQYPVDAKRHDDVAAAGARGTQVLVLQTLIENFGGEATGSALGERMAKQVPHLFEGNTQSGAGLRAVLSQLESCHAVALEDMGGRDIIARITSEGVSLAYDQP